MAKIAVVSGLLFIALLAFGAEAGNQSMKCQQQVQQSGDQIKQCQQYLLNGSKYELDVITQRSILQHHRLKQCCQGLEILEGQCRCDAVKVVVIELKRQGQEQSQSHQVETIEEKIERAKSLPQACNLEPHQC